MGDEADVSTMDLKEPDLREEPEGVATPSGRLRFVDARTGQSATIGKLVMALAKAQGAYEPITKTKTVTVASRKEGARSYTFNYAPLEEIIRATRMALANNGLAIMQRVYGGGDTPLFLRTELWHETGEFLSSTVELPKHDPGPQAFGSVVTYMRRYILAPMLNVAAEEDDDGNTAEGNTATSYDRSPPRQVQGAPTARPKGNGTGQMEGLEKVLIGTLKWTEQQAGDWLMKAFKTRNPDSLTPANFEKAMQAAAKEVERAEAAAKDVPF